MRSDHVLCLGPRGFHRMQYYDWGDPDNPRIVLCVHGLTRSGRDFDYLAGALSAAFRVVCPDIVGRGRSDWLQTPQDYAYPQYTADITALIARVTGGGREKSICWVGTSMGAMLGMAMAATPGNPLRALVLNDAGMHIPKAALERLARYTGKDPRFATYEALEAHARLISAPFGNLTDAQWRHITTHCSKQHDDGTWGFCYDPAIAHALSGELQDINLSAYWDAVRCPTLLLRGENSDILTRETAEAMTQRGPRPKLVEFGDVGHAPMLLCDEQVAVVREFLLTA